MVGLATFGGWCERSIVGFGEFCAFTGRTISWIGPALTQRRNYREILRQCYEIGSRSVPVILVTGIFVGAVLAVQAVQQFKAMNMVNKMGTVVNLSVLRELGPVLAGVMLAGRVGGGLTAELGTMHVTEQIDALRAMGADPHRVLIVPRLLACVFLIPILTLYACIMGILGGYFTSVFIYGANGSEFWANAAETVGVYDVFYGPIKSLFFGAVMCMISCYKGFRCDPGAAGVGRACTQSFVASTMAILTLDFFLGMTLNRLIEQIWGVRALLV